MSIIDDLNPIAESIIPRLEGVLNRARLMKRWMVLVNVFSFSSIYC